ncbi:hypothetical protein [Aureimonas leprariae]|uniref:hypothetical protein n=1 Tax=Plantimonas leprariae TaxID=2615207 RepID=UPI0013866D92|nr:hypothetical protein [Aureimonas leprariae]
MKTLLAATLGLGLVAAATLPSFANCAGHMADKQDKPVTTADTGNGNPPPPTDRQG